VLGRLVGEVDAGGADLLQASIYEVQRVRPVINGAARQVVAEEMPLGQWVIPCGYTVIVDIALTHLQDSTFSEATRFDPYRFINGVPDSYSWVPFGGGTRRCLGAAFANMEMNVVLRTILRECRLSTTSKPDEMWHDRGVAFAPALGGLAMVSRRARAGHMAAHSAIAGTGHPSRVVRPRESSSPTLGLDDGGCTGL
jgi:cytochrome P450 family 138